MRSVADNNSTLVMAGSGEAILDRVRIWPPERQADLAHAAELMEAQYKSVRLSDGSSRKRTAAARR